MSKKTAEDLRSHRWFGVQDMRSSGHRSRTMQMGYAKEDFASKPIIAIVNTRSDLNPCHMHFRMRAEEVKRGVWQAGGFPVELPAVSLGEIHMKPTTMLYRNLLAVGWIKRSGFTILTIVHGLSSAAWWIRCA